MIYFRYTLALRYEENKIWGGMRTRDLTAAMAHKSSVTLAPPSAIGRNALSNHTVFWAAAGSVDTGQTLPARLMLQVTP